MLDLIAFALIGVFVGIATSVFLLVTVVGENMFLSCLPSAVAEHLEKQVMEKYYRHGYILVHRSQVTMSPQTHAPTLPDANAAAEEVPQESPMAPLHTLERGDDLS